MRGILIISLLVVSSGLRAQDVVKDLALINAYYSDAESLDLEMTYRMNMGSGVAVQESKGRYVKQGAKMFSEMGGVTVVQDDVRRVSLQEKQRLLMISPPDTTSLEALQGMDLQKLLGKAGETRLLGEKEGQRGYLLGAEKLLGSNMKNVEVWFNPKDGSIARLVMRFREMEINYDPNLDKGTYSPYAEVIYTRSNRNTSVSQSVFNTGKYVTADGNSIRPKAAYSHYELINSMRR